MICGICGLDGHLERNGNHASCNALSRKSGRVKATSNGKSIDRLSEKGKDIERRYLNRLKSWKKGKKCMATFPHECTDVIECHHAHGRGKHYFDEQAEQADIPLTLDERWWRPLCSNAHRIVTDDSVLAWREGLSFKRVSDPIFRKAD
jgi:hypothetical protein